MIPSTFWTDDIYTMAMVLGALMFGGAAWIALDSVMGGWND